MGEKGRVKARPLFKQEIMSTMFGMDDPGKNAAR